MSSSRRRKPASGPLRRGSESNVLKLSGGPSSPLAHPASPYPTHALVASHLSGLAASSPFDGVPSNPVLHSTRISPGIAAPCIGAQLQYAPVMLDAMNTETEHWLVVGKEEAEQVDDPSAVEADGNRPSHNSNMVVTFPPGSYIVVPGVEVGRNAWFKAQKCTCNTYRHGFLRVRRPATIREHLSKQHCAPEELAHLAELQLKLLRSCPRKSSSASAQSVASGSHSPRLPLSPGIAPSMSPPTFAANSAGAAASPSSPGLPSSTARWAQAQAAKPSSTPRALYGTPGTPGSGPSGLHQAMGDNKPALAHSWPANTPDLPRFGSASHGYGSPDESSLSAFYAAPPGQPFSPNTSAGGSHSPMFAPGGGGPMMSGSLQTYGSTSWGMSDAPSHMSGSYHSGPSHAWMAPQTQGHAQVQNDKTLFSFPLSAPSRAFHTSSSPFAHDYGHGSSSYSNSTYTNTNMNMNTQVNRRDRAHPEAMEGMHSYSNDPDLFQFDDF